MTAPIPLYPRRAILAAFYLVIVLLGIPYWHKSTAVERLPLPFALVAHWAAKSENVFAVPGPEDRRERGKDENVVRFARRYKLAFSLMNEDSSVGNGNGSILHWDIDRLLQQYMDPILDPLRPLHNFTVETSLQYFAPLSIEARPACASDSSNEIEEGSAGTIIEEDDLRAFVNSAKWKIASSVRQEPVLNFILYVPSVPHRPMHIKTNSGAISRSNAFITPQWGGIVIHNPPSSSSPAEMANLDRSFQLFQVQLKKLFGVPPSAAPHNPKQDSDNAVAREGALSADQVDSMVRRRIREVAKESVDTLVAIIKLSGDIPNMRIGKEIQRDMRRSLDELDLAATSLPSSPLIALSHLSQSLTYASSAYYNPSMLALLYFPDEHKYAVYTPLFGPMMVPLLIAAVKELIAWKKERKTRRDKLKLL